MKSVPTDCIILLIYSQYQLLVSLQHTYMLCLKKLRHPFNLIQEPMHS